MPLKTAWFHIITTGKIDAKFGFMPRGHGAIHAVINCAGMGGSMKIFGRGGHRPMEWFTTRLDGALRMGFNRK